MRAAIIDNVEELFLKTTGGADITATTTGASIQGFTNIVGNGFGKANQILSVISSASTLDLSALVIGNWNGGDRVVINGTNDGDTIIGTSVNDVITGGGSTNRFVWLTKLQGGDTITDFTREADKLMFAAGEFSFSGTRVLYGDVRPRFGQSRIR